MGGPQRRAKQINNLHHRDSRGTPLFVQASKTAQELSEKQGASGMVALMILATLIFKPKPMYLVSSLKP